MAIMTLEDFTGRLSVIAFPKIYHTAVREIYQDNIVGIEGRFSIDERESKIIAMSVHKLSNEEPRELMLVIAKTFRKSFSPKRTNAGFPSLSR